MNGMILHSHTEHKDIKLSSKKGEDTKDKENEDLFENLISTLLSEEKEGESSNFLLGKLLNLSSDFSEKGKIISEFSKGDIISEEEDLLTSLEELFKVALAVKNGESFTTDSPTLKVALEDSNIISEFKEAKNIKELLKIADKNGIKVKNFEFLNPELALNSADKKMVQKVTSEDIFKMVNQKIAQKEMPATSNVLSKIIKQELNKDKVTKKEDKSTLTSLLSKDTQTKSTSEKIIPTDVSNKNKLKKIDEAKNTAGLKKVDEPKNLTELKKVDEAKNSAGLKKVENKDVAINKEQQNETFKNQKVEKSQHNTLATLLKNDTSSTSKPLQTQAIEIKDETAVKTESEAKEITTEKSNHHGEIKSDLHNKIKETPDIKKTFSTFAMEFKEKVEAYKPPMMKINMQLSPGNLGDVDVTLINRGNNLQVNINSASSSTLALFVQNQAEFKNSLVNMGFSDLQMNFGDKRGEERGNNPQQQKQKEPQSDYHDNEQEEQTSGIDMTIPNYI